MSAPDIDIGGFKNDPLNGTSSGPVRQAVALPYIGIPKARLPAVAVPGLGLSYNAPGSNWTFGTLVYLSQAMSMDRTKDPNDPARFDGRLIQLQRLNYLSPTAAYKVIGHVAASAWRCRSPTRTSRSTPISAAPNKLLGTVGQLQRRAVPGRQRHRDRHAHASACAAAARTAMVDPFKRAANIDFDMHASFDPTFNLGILWEPKKWFALGMVYQGGSAPPPYRRRTMCTPTRCCASSCTACIRACSGPIVGADHRHADRYPRVPGGNMTPGCRSRGGCRPASS